MLGVLYTGWLVEKRAVGPEFDSNTPQNLFKMVVGKGRTIQVGRGGDKGKEDVFFYVLNYC